MVMSLQTPNKIRTLQRKRYLKVKAEPDYRFHLLYEKIYREDILRHAYDLMRANDGAPAVDGVTFTMIETQGLNDLHCHQGKVRASDESRGHHRLLALAFVFRAAPYVAFCQARQPPRRRAARAETLFAGGR